MKHMTLEDREKIEDLLKQNYNFTKISEVLGYHRTTIADEIVRHKVHSKLNTYGTSFVNCAKLESCDKCNGKVCTRKCTLFEPIKCNILNKAPYVCNGCPKKSHCRFQKIIYIAREAQKQYEKDLSESRIGIRIPEEHIDKINKVITPLIVDKSQTVNQVYINHPDLLYFSKTEFYNLINLGVFKFRNIDLPRKVSYKHCNKKYRRTREESKIRINRTYKDYENFLEKHPLINVIEMDTVERNNDGKCLLTLHFKQYGFMLMYLLNAQTKECVIKKINWIRNILGKDRYKRIFQLILTDNGHEFFDIDGLEKWNNELVTNVFYCDPGASYQKGSCEENHHYISYIVPKDGNYTFDNLEQNDVNLIMSHINSVPRDCLGNITPIDAIKSLITEDELHKLGISEIPKDEVCLNYKLIGRRLKKDYVDGNRD